MASIYSQASRVLVWLEPEQCGPALDELRPIGSSYEQASYPSASGKANTLTNMGTSRASDGHGEESRYYNGFEDPEDGDEVYIAFAQSTYTCPVLVRDSNLVALGDLFGRAWFTRVS
jgi:hypothetical protein